MQLAAIVSFFTKKNYTNSGIVLLLVRAYKYNKNVLPIQKMKSVAFSTIIKTPTKVMQQFFGASIQSIKVSVVKRHRMSM